MDDVAELSFSKVDENNLCTMDGDGRNDDEEGAMDVGDTGGGTSIDVRRGDIDNDGTDCALNNDCDDKDAIAGDDVTPTNAVDATGANGDIPGSERAHLRLRSFADVASDGVDIQPSLSALPILGGGQFSDYIFF